MNPSIDFSTLPLRDIHLPDAVSWWPPAPGWWVLLAAVVAGLALLAWRRHRYRRHRAALAAIERIRAELDAGGEPVRALQGLSVVLRRFAISAASERDARRVPGLIGAGWLEYLDTHGGGDAFRRGAGRMLLDAPYAPAGTASREQALELGALLAEWIRSQDPGAARAAGPWWRRPGLDRLARRFSARLGAGVRRPRTPGSAGSLPSGG